MLFLVRPNGSNPGLTVFTLPFGEAALRGQVDGFRKLIIERRTASDPTLVARSRALYDELVGPAEPLLSDSHHILVVPDGPLYFAAISRTHAQFNSVFGRTQTISHNGIGNRLCSVEKGTSR